MSCVFTFLYLQITQHFSPQYNSMHLYTYYRFLPSNLHPFLDYTLSELFVAFFNFLLTLYKLLWDLDTAMRLHKPVIIPTTNFPYLFMCLSLKVTSVDCFHVNFHFLCIQI